MIGIFFVQSEICLVQVKAETPALRLPQTLFARGGIRKLADALAQFRGRHILAPFDFCGFLRAPQQSRSSNQSANISSISLCTDRPAAKSGKV